MITKIKNSEYCFSLYEFGTNRVSCGQWKIKNVPPSRVVKRGAKTVEGADLTNDITTIQKLRCATKHLGKHLKSIYQKRHRKL